MCLKPKECQTNGCIHAWADIHNFRRLAEEHREADNVPIANKLTQVAAELEAKLNRKVIS